MNGTPHSAEPSRKPLRTLDAAQQKSLIDFLTIETNAALNKVTWYRNACMILLMLDAGLRVAEVCGLRRNDLWFGQGAVIDLVVKAEIAKNGIERTVPLSDRLRESIRRLCLIFWQGNDLPAKIPAFFAVRGRYNITPRQVQRIVKQITQTLLGVPFTPHSLRHTFATKMMHLTDIRTVQMLLGHASLTSTQVYTHPTLSDLRSAINKTNGT
jgi:site-specific recombinase XerD